MSNKLYITAIEDRSGKSLITMGIMEILLINIEKVAFFRPFIDVDPEKNQKDNDLILISETFGLDIPYDDMYAFTVAEASHLASEGRQAEVLEEILNKFTRLEETYDFVLCEGTDFRGSTASFELDINAQIANHLGCPVILVGKAKNKTIDEAITAIEISVDAVLKKGNNIIATFINRVPAGEESFIINALKKRVFFKDQLIYAIPEVRFLNDPTMGEIIKLLDARVLYGEHQTDLPVHRYIVAAMQLRNFLQRIEYGALVITPGDRADVIIATLSNVMSSTMPYISGIVLTGGLVPEEPVHKLIQGFKRIVPILSVDLDTFPAVRKIDTLNTVIMPGDSRKISLSLATFEEWVNMAELEDKIISSQTSIVTPIMFEYRLLQKARLTKQHIVLPEGEEPRILRATEILLNRSVVDITLLGDRARIERNAAHLGLKIEGASIIDPSSSDLLEDYIETYCELRKHKGVTRDSARDIMMDVNFFGTMMVYRGHANGLVSGAVHTTADTIRPAFQFIKTSPGCSIVSSVMLMCLKDRVLVYGDCAVNPNPDSETLSEIAMSSAATARLFKIEPRVAMLSYATGESGKGADVDTVREAVRITEKKIAASDSGFQIEGPIQYDAAVDSAVAKTKMPESEVAGKATVFIFPDLNTGNNTYKAVQRSAGAVAIGPVLQGLRKPVNDLSRGCLVNDIVNTVAITAVQAQGN